MNSWNLQVEPLNDDVEVRLQTYRPSCNESLYLITSGTTYLLISILYQYTFFVKSRQYLCDYFQAVTVLHLLTAQPTRMKVVTTPRQTVHPVTLSVSSPTHACHSQTPALVTKAHVTSHGTRTLFNFLTTCSSVTSL